VRACGVRQAWERHRSKHRARVTRWLRLGVDDVWPRHMLDPRHHEHLLERAQMLLDRVGAAAAHAAHAPGPADPPALPDRLEAMFARHRMSAHQICAFMERHCLPQDGVSLRDIVGAWDALASLIEARGPVEQLAEGVRHLRQALGSAFVWNGDYVTAADVASLNRTRRDA
jgi:hypothetical protein